MSAKAKIEYITIYRQAVYCINITPIFIVHTLSQYTAIRPIMYLCLVAKRRSGPRVTMWWWEQDGLDFYDI